MGRKASTSAERLPWWDDGGFAVATGKIYLDVYIDNDSKRQSVYENIELSFCIKTAKQRGVS